MANLHARRKHWRTRKQNLIYASKSGIKIIPWPQLKVRVTWVTWPPDPSLSRSVLARFYLSYLLACLPLTLWMNFHEIYEGEEEILDYIFWVMHWSGSASVGHIRWVGSRDFSSQMFRRHSPGGVTRPSRLCSVLYRLGYRPTLSGHDFVKYWILLNTTLLFFWHAEWSVGKASQYVWM